MPQKYRILITGSSGMLGVDLCQELKGSYDIYGLDLIAQSPNRPIADFYECDISDKKRVADIIAKIKPDVVIHTAAWTDVDGCEIDKDKAYKINMEGTKNIALACKRIGAVIIYLSTDFVFDGKKRKPYKECDKPHPLSVYGDSKLKGENFIKKTLKRYFILHTSWLYGQHGKNFVDIILEKAKSEKVLKVVNDQVGSPTYTKDLVRAIHKLLDKIVTRSPGHQATSYGIYHVSNSGSTSWYEYAKEIVRDRGTKVTPISTEELARPARRPAMSILDNSKFIRFTGYKLRDWKDALKERLC